MERKVWDQNIYLQIDHLNCYEQTTITGHLY